ncbi:MAG TPA: rod shape-determining protein MreD [Agitococcus sp.]|nr:rod shape-determining protein MreD [Agitococcus sp.]
MNTKGLAIYRAMALSLATILLLSFWPIVLEWRYFRPDWLALWLVFWSLYYPQYIGVWIALGIGLLWDLSTGSLLGSYGISCAVVVYLSRRLGRNYMMFNGVEKTVLVMFLLLIAIVLRLGIWLLLGRPHSYLRCSKLVIKALILLESGLFYCLGYSKAVIES